MPSAVVPVKDDAEILDVALLIARKAGKTQLEAEILVALWRIADALESEAR